MLKPALDVRDSFDQTSLQIFTHQRGPDYGQIFLGLVNLGYVRATRIRIRILTLFVFGYAVSRPH